MKYVLKFELERNELKADYRRTFISFFKKAISEYMEGRFFDEIYGAGAGHKDFVWSIKLDKPKFKNERIELGSNSVIMTLKTADTNTAQIYYSSCLGMKLASTGLRRGEAYLLFFMLGNEG